MSLPSAATLLRGLAAGIVVVAWSLLGHYGSAGDGNADLAAALATAPLAACFVMLLWQAGKPLWTVAGGLALLGLIAWTWPALRQNVALLYYVQHLGINLALATLFGRSLTGDGQPLVTQFALLAHDGVISPAKYRYTRQLTLAWVIFFLANVGISTLLFGLASAEAWSVFTNLLATPLVGLMFGIEHLVRNRVLPPEDRTTIADTIRGYRASLRRNQPPLAKQP